MSESSGLLWPKSFSGPGGVSCTMVSFPSSTTTASVFVGESERLLCEGMCVCVLLICVKYSSFCFLFVNLCWVFKFFLFLNESSVGE